MDDCDWLLSVEKACDWLRIEPGVTRNFFLGHLILNPHWSSSLLTVLLLVKQFQGITPNITFIVKVIRINQDDRVSGDYRPGPGDY